MDNFSLKVVKLVSRIKRGKTMTYGEIAKKAGNKKAARSVGGILNRYFLECVRNNKKTIPCHRVVRSDGRIGGYAKGEKEKRRLLKEEKAI